jgi:hypothetical protein
MALQAETRKENRYWQYRLYRSNYRLQLWLNGDLPDYNRDFFLNRLDDGTIRFQEREQTTGTLTTVVIAQQEKDAAIRGYLDALRTYWQLYYDLRRLTLYDFAESRLLYRPE